MSQGTQPRHREVCHDVVAGAMPFGGLQTLQVAEVGWETPEMFPVFPLASLD